MCLAVALPGCGGSAPAGGTSSRRAKPAALAGSPTIAGSPRPPKIDLPPGPSPRRLIVRDLRRGSGPGIPPGRELEIKSNFTSISYRTGKLHEVEWSRQGSFTIPFGPKLEIEGWEKGLVGMKVGGRRELRVPSRMAYDEGAIVYLVELLGWRPISSPSEVEFKR